MQLLVSAIQKKWLVFLGLVVALSGCSSVKVGGYTYKDPAYSGGWIRKPIIEVSDGTMLERNLVVASFEKAAVESDGFVEITNMQDVLMPTRHYSLEEEWAAIRSSGADSIVYFLIGKRTKRGDSSFGTGSVAVTAVPEGEVIWKGEYRIDGYVTNWNKDIEGFVAKVLIDLRKDGLVGSN